MHSSSNASLLALLIAIVGLLLIAPPAGAQHDFCVMRPVGGASQTIRSRVHVSGEDPGPEAAALHLARHYRRAFGAGVHIEPFEAARCPALEIQEIALGPPGIHDREAPEPPFDPNVGRIANVASATALGVASEATRLVCRFLPC